MQKLGILHVARILLGEGCAERDNWLGSFA